MDALNNHPTLKGLFDRAGSVVQAVAPEAHRGYQAWHREIERIMIEWINSPFHQEVTANEFWRKLYELYNTQDMINRFGKQALDYIRGMMK